MVAMSGSIIPTPLATPTTRGSVARRRSLGATFGWVSVVIIAAATRVRRSTGAVGNPARCERIRSIGYRRR